jgi:DNA-binding NarL/FixJ family response regulator
MKILLADDHPLFREGVKQVLDKLDAGTQILDAPDYPELFAQASAHPDLDLALVDLNMPGMPARSGIVEFRQRFPDLPLVVLSASESPRDVEECLNAGALGYIPKSSPSGLILHALNTVLSGSIFIPDLEHRSAQDPGFRGGDKITKPDKSLTTRQMEVLRCLLRGMPNKAIAKSLDLTEGTVKIHLAAIFRVLHVSNRTEAVIAARKAGFDDSPHISR